MAPWCCDRQPALCGLFHSGHHRHRETVRDHPRGVTGRAHAFCFSWFKYESDGVLFTSGTFGGCVEYEDCSPCLFWKDRNSNGTAGLDPLCQFYSTKDYKPPSRWGTSFACILTGKFFFLSFFLMTCPFTTVNGGYVAIFMSVVGLIVALICVVLSFLMFIGILRGMKGSVVMYEPEVTTFVTLTNDHHVAFSVFVFSCHFWRGLSLLPA